MHAAATAVAQSTQNSPSAAAPAPTATALPARPQALATPLPQSLNDVANASQLYQKVGGAEMHVNMQTDLLGAIELHATVHDNTLTATIGVQRSDVQSLLANDLPSLQHALAEQSLHVEQISVMDSSVGGGLDLGGHAQQQQPSRPQSTALPSQMGFDGTLGARSQAQSPSSDSSSLALGRLSILA